MTLQLTRKILVVPGGETIAIQLIGTALFCSSWRATVSFFAMRRCRFRKVTLTLLICEYFNSFFSVLGR